jgi:hypothetical protein
MGWSSSGTSLPALLLPGRRESSLTKISLLTASPRRSPIYQAQTFVQKGESAETYFFSVLRYRLQFSAIRPISIDWELIKRIYKQDYTLHKNLKISIQASIQKQLTSEISQKQYAQIFISIVSNT